MVRLIESVWRRPLVRLAVPSVASVLLLCVAVFAVVLPAVSESQMARKREMIRELTQVVWETLEVNHREELAGHLTRAQAQERAVRRSRHLRYGPHDQGYFWLNDLHPRMILHPYRPELEGSDLTDYVDPQGNRVFTDLVDLVRAQEAGYIAYTWQWKDERERSAPKISYVKLFEPWGWVVGTGVYVDDVRAEIAAVTRHLTLVSMAALAFSVVLSAYVVWQGSRAERERQSAEKQKRVLSEQLHQAQKVEALGELAAGVAHDFNNLLTVVQGNTELVARTLAPDSPARSAVETLEEATREAAGITRSLLTFSRKLPGEKAPTDLAQVIQEVSQVLDRMLPASIDLVVDVSAQPAPIVLGDATQLKQVLMNLVINARDAMPRGGTVRLSLRTCRACGADDPDDAGDFVQLSVSDTGTGMAPEVQARVFEPFFTTKPRGQGTGLGLSVTHGIVTDHGGQIRLVSSPGEGSTFSICLPRLAGPAVPAQEQPSTEPVIEGGDATILLAEDHRFVRQMLASTLSELGYRVVQAANGAQLMQEFERHRSAIDILLIDADLPNRSGLDCLNEIREQGFRAPAIIMTGSVAMCDQGVLPCDTWLLPKPFRMAELAARLRHALKSACCGVCGT